MWPQFFRIIFCSYFARGKSWKLGRMSFASSAPMTNSGQGLFPEDKLFDQSLGDDRVDIAIAYRRIARLADNHDRFGVAVPHAADLDDRAIDVMLLYLVSESPDDFQSAGGATAGGGAHHDYRFIQA